MRKILIIEDEIIVAKDIEQILSNNGYEVLGIASSYSRAVEKIRTSNPDLILCDINLNSEKTGIELMSEFEYKLTTPFIFISAYSDSDTIKKAFNLAPKNFITKPFNEKQMLTSIEAALLASEKQAEPSSRELTIIKLLSQGYSSKEIADELSISFFTVETHRKNLIKKYNVQTSAELICLATSNGWISYKDKGEKQQTT